MKYMGSKSRISKYIAPIIQAYIDENNIKKYVEPFVGGANMIDKIQCDKKYGSDSNKYLISLLKYVQEDNELYEFVDKETYNKARDCFNNNLDTFKDWELGNIGFLASFNGRWFDGGYAKTGIEKTKNGERVRNYYEESKSNLLNQAKEKEFKNVKFGICNYADWTKYLNNCVIYCDPPYANTKQYNNAKSFDYELFWNTMREWSKNNIVLISEENAPNDFQCIWEAEVSRSIKPTDKTKSTEKLFKYGVDRLKLM